MFPHIDLVKSLKDQLVLLLILGFLLVQMATVAAHDCTVASCCAL